jgi:lipopolysaccharide biosynthesis glycosyltransferase
MAFSRVKKYHIFDQDVLNLLCEGRITWIDYKWNVPSLTEQKRAYLETAPEDVLQKLHTAYKDPGIIHYTDKLKPWDDPYSDKAEEFWAMARDTPFYETLLFRMYNKQAVEKLENSVLHPAEFELIPVPQGHLPRRVIRKLLLTLAPLNSKRRYLLDKLYVRLKKLIKNL